MSNSDDNANSPGQTTRKVPAREAPQHSVNVYDNVPETTRPVRRVGPRRRFPRVPDGARTPDNKPSGPMPPRKQALSAAMAGSPPAIAGVTLIANAELTAVATSGTTSSVGEPSVATNGNFVFYTGNWYAAVSGDGGMSFTYLNPYTSFPDPPGMSFCCDQVVNYIPSIDMFVWLLQYTTDANNQNIERLAFATSADAQANRWRTYDISPQDLALPLMMLDFPDLSFSSNNLYVTCNAFDAVGHWTTSLILRIPLSSLVSGAPSADVWSTNQNFALRAVQHCDATAYFASHVDTSTLRIFRWDETAAVPLSNDVTVASWEESPFVSQTPDHFNWLGRADSRVLGSALSNGQLWFAWGANSGGANQRPNPYVQIANIDLASWALIQNVNLWDASSAIQYAALESTSDGDVGVSYFFGGGTTFPSHAVGFLTGVSDHVVTVSGSFGPVGQLWGDYLTLRRSSPNGRRLSATAFIQKNGTAEADVAPRYVLFSR